MTGVQRYPLWSPDGLRIIYWAAASAELRIFSVESLSEQAVAGDYRPLAWLSRSESILVTANHQPPAIEGGYSSWQVSLLDLASGSLTRVPFLDAGTPLDRPDGLPIRGNQQYWLEPNDLVLVLTIREGDGYPGLGIYDVYAGSFTPIPDSVISYPSDGIPPGAVTFSEDGAQIYWLDYQQQTTMYKANIDGTGLQRVADWDNPVGPVLSPDLTAFAYTESTGPNPGVNARDAVTLYVASTNVPPATFEIDSGTAASGFARFSVVWRPRP